MWKSIGRWMLRQLWLLIMFVLVGITIYFAVKSSEFRSTFLLDRYGKFQWVGVSAIFAGLGLFLSTNFKKQEIRANIFAKNELKILQSFRKDCSEFSALLWEYKTLFRKFDNKISNGFENGFDEQKMIRDLNTLFAKIEFKRNFIIQDTAIYKNDKKFNFFTHAFLSLNIPFQDSIYYVNEKNYKEEKNIYVQYFDESISKFIDCSSEYIALVYSKQLRNLGQK